MADDIVVSSVEFRQAMREVQLTAEAMNPQNPAHLTARRHEQAVLMHDRLAIEIAGAEAAHKAMADEAGNSIEEERIAHRVELDRLEAQQARIGQIIKTTSQELIPPAQDRGNTR